LRTIFVCLIGFIYSCSGTSQAIPPDSNVDSGASISDVWGSDVVSLDSFADLNVSDGADLDVGIQQDSGGVADSQIPSLGNPGVLGPYTYTYFENSDVAGVPLSVYVPDVEGSLEVVVFSHGFQLTPDRYEIYGEHLASWGYIVVMPALPGSLFSPTSHSTLSGYVKSVLDWIDESSSNSTHPLYGLANPDKIALAGHSMGGKVSLLTATSDSRVRAVFGIDPVDTPGGPLSSPSPENPSVTPELMSQISVPLVLLGETTNAKGGGLFSPACAPEDDNFHQYFIHTTSPALEIEMVGANHMSFIDQTDCGLTCSACPSGSDDVQVTKQRTAQYMTAFFHRALRGESGYNSYLTGDAMNADVAAGLVKIATRNGF
jgi:pimeloyl-ACP methyl ester carboxylesterase